VSLVFEKWQIINQLKFVFTVKDKNLFYSTTPHDSVYRTIFRHKCTLFF